jgi:hypothetical protein
MLVISKFGLLFIMLITPNIINISGNEIINIKNKCKIQTLNKINNQRLFNCIINDFENCHYIDNYNDYIKMKNKCIQNNYIYEFICKSISIYKYLKFIQ